MSDVQSVVVLIHGTFARGKRWPEVEAICRKRLSAPCVVEYFEWTGKNLVDARAEAATDLRRQLTSWLAQYPSAQFYLVAHSHGGNVALHALANLEQSERVSCLICLSTPFVDAKLRSAARPTVAVSALLWCGGLTTWSVLTFGWLGVIPGIVLAAPILWTFLAFKRLRTRAAALLGSVQTPQPVFPRLFILRSPVDEASIALTVAQAIHGGFASSREQLNLYTILPAIVGVLALFGAVAWFLGPSTYEWTKNHAIELIHWLTTAAPESVSSWIDVVINSRLAQRAGSLALIGGIVWAYVYAVVTLFQFVLYFAALGLSLLSSFPMTLVNARLLGRTFGFRARAAASMHLDLAIEPMPPGTFECCQLPWPETIDAKERYHSLTYKDPGALAQVERWLMTSQARADG